MKTWEQVALGLRRVEVEGGWVYEHLHGVCFAPRQVERDPLAAVPWAGQEPRTGDPQPALSLPEYQAHVFNRSDM